MFGIAPGRLGRVGSPTVGRWGAISLASMFANGEKGWVRIPLPGVGIAYQERTGASATTVCASGDPCGTFHDLITNTYWVASADSRRPIYTVSGGLTYLDYDGSDDCLYTTASINWGTNKAFLIEALEVDVVGTQIVTEFSAAFATNEQTFMSTQGEGALNGRATWGINGSNAGAGNAGGRYDGGGALPRKYVGECLYDLAGTTFATCIFPKTNGVTPSLTDTGAANPGGGNFGNFVAYDGARGDASLRFNGRKYASICINRDPTAAEKTFLRTLFASLSGVTL